MPNLSCKPIFPFKLSLKLSHRFQGTKVCTPGHLRGSHQSPQTTRNGAYIASFSLHGVKLLRSNCSRPNLSKSLLPFLIYLIHPKGLLITHFSPLSALTLCWLIDWSIGPLAHWPIGLLVCHNYLFVCFAVFRLFTSPVQPHATNVASFHY